MGRGPIAAWFEDGEMQMKKNLWIGTGALAGDWSLDGRRTGISSTVRTVAPSNRSRGARWTAAALHGCRTGNPISPSWHQLGAAALARRPPHFISVGQGIPSMARGVVGRRVEHWLAILVRLRQRPRNVFSSGFCTDGVRTEHVALQFLFVFLMRMRLYRLRAVI
jgi:hypothetical protein